MPACLHAHTDVHISYESEHETQLRVQSGATHVIVLERRLRHEHGTSPPKLSKLCNLCVSRGCVSMVSIGWTFEMISLTSGRAFCCEVEASQVERRNRSRGGRACARLS
eukprot:5677549-Amphidinium_carterae.1